jgi:uncharacterized protein
MMNISKRTLGLGLTAAAIAAAAGVAIAQTGAPAWPQIVTSALSVGDIGEQADGYLGIKGTASSALRAEVDAINIKRRAAYLQLAQQRGKTIKEVGAAIGCETLAKRVAVGRSYLLPDGVWRERSAGEAIALPDYCGPQA